MNQNKQKLLNKTDPDPVTIHHGNNLLVFTFPHNEINVPKNVMPCLGMEPEWFKTAHEARDLYMAETYDMMREKFPDATFIKGNYSRLVVDLNRHPDYAVRLDSSENRNILIPQNQPDTCCEKQTAKRMEEIYHPYHSSKKQAIKAIHEKHGGAIVLDMHSFTPTWEGQERTFELGTIRANKTPLSCALEDFFKHNQSDYKYVSGKPYRVADRPENAAAYIQAECEIQYLGIEIRNDLLKNQQKREKLINFLEKSINHLNEKESSDPDLYKMITAIRKPEQNKTHETVYDSWMI